MNEVEDVRRLALATYDAATAAHCREREREYRRTIWAMARAAWPNPIRVSVLALDAWTPDCEIQTRTDHQTRELLIFAILPVTVPSESAIPAVAVQSEP